MARTTHPLTATEVLRPKAIDKDLTLHDGNGLFRVVKTTGKKLWRYQRPAIRQRTMLGLGALPALTLADARRVRVDYLSLLANGIDPQTQAGQVTEQQHTQQRSSQAKQNHLTKVGCADNPDTAAQAAYSADA